MSETAYKGIDYGLGTTNIDAKTGIRYGVISQNSVMPEAIDDLWQNSRDLSHESAVQDFKLAISRIETTQELAELLDERLHCRIPAEKWACELMAGYTDPESDGEIALGTRTTSEFVESVWSEVEDTFNDQYDDNGERDWLYEKEGYRLTGCLQSDVMVLLSPYFTHAQFCSPCVPGACNLDSPCADGERAYCLGHDYFEGNKAPYPVYSVETGLPVMA